MMMYFLKSGTNIKGFRGWITDVNSTAASKKISINPKSVVRLNLSLF